MQQHACYENAFLTLFVIIFAYLIRLIPPLPPYRINYLYNPIGRLLLKCHFLKLAKNSLSDADLG
jgi:hypothetical protein